MAPAPPTDCVPLLRDAHLSALADWASERPVRHGWKGRTCQDLWDASPRGDWLLGWAKKIGADRRDLVRAAAACVRPALRFVPAGEDRPRLAVEAAERWADEPTEGNRAKAERAARAASGVAEGAAARAASWASKAAGMTGAAVWWMEAEPWLAGWAANQAADAHLIAEGPESEARAHAACAAEVRRLIPFLDLSATS